MIYVLRENQQKMLYFLFQETFQRGYCYFLYVASFHFLREMVKINQNNMKTVILLVYTSGTTAINRLFKKKITKRGRKKIPSLPMLLVYYIISYG